VTDNDQCAELEAHGLYLEGLDEVSLGAHPAIAEYLRKAYWPADSVLAAHALRGIEAAGYRLVRAEHNDGRDDADV